MSQDQDQAQDAGLEIDYDAELARLQRLSGTMPRGSEDDDDVRPAAVIDGSVVDDGRTVTT
jgi:hypothetical protein